MVLSFQEMVQKTTDQRRALKRVMGRGVFHPDDCSIFHGLKPADRAELHEAYRTYSLAEFLAKSGTTGIAGAAYLVPDKLFDTLIMYSKQSDIVPLISFYVAGTWGGGDMNTAAVHQDSYEPKPFSSGGTLAIVTPEIGQATISPIAYGIPLVAGKDLMEDQNWDLIEIYARQAAIAMGRKMSELALTVLKTATDGWGTKNGALSGDGNETKWTNATTDDIQDCLTYLEDDHWIADTLILTTEAWHHSVKTTLPVQGSANEVPWPRVARPPADGFHATMGMPPLDVLFSNNKALHDGGVPGTAMTSCVTIVFNRQNALVTGRKRWMEIKEFSNPVSDIDTAVISCRQDSVTINDDAVATITET